MHVVAEDYFNDTIRTHSSQVKIPLHLLISEALAAVYPEHSWKMYRYFDPHQGRIGSKGQRIILLVDIRSLQRLSSTSLSKTVW